MWFSAKKVIIQVSETLKFGEVGKPICINPYSSLFFFHLQVESVKRIFEKHSDIASGVHTKSPHLRTTYINVLLGLIETMCQSPQDLSDDDLKEASATVSYAVNIGFKLDWLEKKLTELCEKKTKLRTVEARLPELEEELQNLNKKCSDLKALLEKSKAEVAGAKTPLSFDDIV